MASVVTRRLAIGATVCGGLLAGVTANRWLVEMPAWERIGVIPWASFLRAENHGVGALFYPVIGFITLLFTISAAIAFRYDRQARESRGLPIYAAAALAITWATITRCVLVPANFRIRAVGDNAGELERIFRSIAPWWRVNDALHVVTFGLSVWALIEILSSRRDGAPAAAIHPQSRASAAGVMDH